MSILDGITAVMSGGLSSVAGGAIALIGSQLTKREERKTLEITLNHEIKKAEFEAQEIAAEHAHSLAMADKKIQQAQTEGEITRDIEETKAFKQSLKAQLMSSGNAVVDMIRSLIRPVITTYLLLVITYLAVSITISIGGIDIIPLADLIELYKRIIHETLFLTTLSVTWWFGARPSSQRR